jgi:Fe-S-cluster containining protein
MSTCTRESGTCQYCRDGCTRKPGWFLPGEAEAAASFMGITLDEFFRAYLAVDWWVDSPADIFVLSPAIRGEEPGTEFPGDPRGTCVFYENDRCAIHPVKPAECRKHWCGDKNSSSIHHDVAQAWAGRQEQITELLGHEPESEDYYGGGGLLGMLGF